MLSARHPVRHRKVTEGGRILHLIIYFILQTPKAETLTNTHVHYITG